MENALATEPSYRFLEAFDRWHAADPTAAYAWLSQRQFLIEDHPEILRSVALAIPRADAFPEACRGLYPEHHAALLAAYVDGRPERPMEEVTVVVFENFNSPVAVSLHEVLGQKWAARNLSGAEAWMASQSLDADPQQAFAAGIVRGLAASSHEHSLRWAQKTDEPLRRTLLVEAAEAAIQFHGARKTIEAIEQLLADDAETRAALGSKLLKPLIRADPIASLDFIKNNGAQGDLKACLAYAFDTDRSSAERWLQDETNRRAAQPALSGIAMQEALKGRLDALEIIGLAEGPEVEKLASQIVYSWQPQLSSAEIAQALNASPHLDSAQKRRLAAQSKRPLLPYELEWLKRLENSNR